MISALTCVPHLRLDGFQLGRLGNEFVDDLIEALRNRLHSSERFLVRFGEVDLVPVNRFVSDKSSDREDLLASRRNLKLRDSIRKHAFAVWADVINKSFGRCSKQCAGSSRRARVNRLSFFENLFNGFGHLLVRRNSIGLRPDHLVVNPERELSAINAGLCEGLSLLVNVKGLTAEIPELFTSNCIEKRNGIRTVRPFDDWIRNHLCLDAAMRTSKCV